MFLGKELIAEFPILAQWVFPMDVSGEYRRICYSCLLGICGGCYLSRGVWHFISLAPIYDFLHC